MTLRCDFCFWPSIDVPIALAKVCFEEKSGSGARFDRMKAEITHRVHSYIAPGPGEAYAFPWRGASGEQMAQ